MRLVGPSARRGEALEADGFVPAVFLWLQGCALRPALVSAGAGGFGGPAQSGAFILARIRSSKCSQPPPAPAGTRPLPGTMIYSCLLKDEYHMGLII